VDIIIKIASLITNSELTPFIIIVLFFVYKLNMQSEQNKKEIEELKSHNQKNQEQEIERLKKQLDNAVEGVKRHDKNNQKHVKKLLLELINDKK